MYLKHFFSLSLIFFVILLNSCDTNENNDEKVGHLRISFRDTFFPTNVDSIRIKLSKEGKSTIVKGFNFVKDTSKTLTFDNLQIGSWLIEAEAFNNSGSLMHSGIYDTTIIHNETINLSLSFWKDNVNNPIINKMGNQKSYGAYFGRVLYDKGMFKMWFTNSYGSDKYDIGYAESIDGLSWQIIKKVVLEAGSPGSWDSYGIHGGAVIKEGNIYKMYFTGQSEPNNPSKRKIGLATSYDGINWTKSNEDVVNQININGYTTDILKVSGVYYLYYGNPDIIGVATSIDGYNWQKSNKSVVKASEPWEGSLLLSCSVIHEKGKFRMLYSNSKLFNKFGYAESEDGINWIKRKTPVFSYEETYNFWPFDIRYPFLRKVGNNYYIFYSTTSSQYESKIGVVTTSLL